MRGLCYLSGVFFLLSLSFFTCLNAATGNPDECLATIEAPDEVCLPTNFQVKITMTSSGDQVHDVDVSVTGITCDYLPKKAKCPGETTIIVSPKTAGTAKISCLTATKNVAVITSSVNGPWTVVQTGIEPLPPSSSTNYTNGRIVITLMNEFSGYIIEEGSGRLTKTYGYDEGMWLPSDTGTGCGDEIEKTFEVSVGFDLTREYGWITLTASGKLTMSTKKMVGEPKRHVRVRRETPYEEITDYRDTWTSQQFPVFGGPRPVRQLPASAVSASKTWFAHNYRVEKKCCEQ